MANALSNNWTLGNCHTFSVDGLRYLYREVPSEIGLGFEVRREGEDKGYHVMLRPHHSCECLGFLRWDHCRHVDGIRRTFLQLPHEERINYQGAGDANQSCGPDPEDCGDLGADFPADSEES